MRVYRAVQTDTDMNMALGKFLKSERKTDYTQMSAETESDGMLIGTSK